MSGKKRKIKKVINFSRELDEILKRGRSGFRSTELGTKYETSRYFITRVRRKWEFKFFSTVTTWEYRIWEPTSKYSSPVDIYNWYYKIYEDRADIVSLPDEDTRRKIRTELVSLVNTHLINTADYPTNDPVSIPAAPEPEDISETELVEETEKDNNVDNRFELLDLDS